MSRGGVVGGGGLEGVLGGLANRFASSSLLLVFFFFEMPSSDQTVFDGDEIPGWRLSRSLPGVEAGKPPPAARRQQVAAGGCPSREATPTDGGGEISAVCPASLLSGIGVKLVGASRSVIMFGPRGNIKGLLELARRYYTAHVPLTNPRVLCCYFGRLFTLRDYK